MKNVTSLTVDLSILQDEIHSEDPVTEHPVVFDIPEETGHMDGVFLHMDHDITIFRGTHRFHAEIVGPDHNTGLTGGTFAEDSFMAGTVLGGWMQQHEHYGLDIDIRFGKERTYFRHADGFEHDNCFEAGVELQQAVLAVPITSMKLLIGIDITNQLLDFLGIEQSPSIAVKEIPLRITNILQNAVNPRLTGSMKQLYCQAKSLEYLCELVELMEKQQQSKPRHEDRQSLIAHIHDSLVNHTGRLPTMSSLASEYGVPARTLNADFAKQYGLSIPQYIARTRLEKAHAIVQHSDVALKQIAASLGYSHVNHFITAFKREFGYPPGSLRK